MSIDVMNERADVVEFLKKKAEEYEVRSRTEDMKLNLTIAVAIQKLALAINDGEHDR